VPSRRGRTRSAGGGPASGSEPAPSFGTWKVVRRPFFWGCRPPTPRIRSSMFWNGSPGTVWRTARPGPRVALSSKSNLGLRGTTVATAEGPACCKTAFSGENAEAGTLRAPVPRRSDGGTPFSSARATLRPSHNEETPGSQSATAPQGTGNSVRTVSQVTSWIRTRARRARRRPECRPIPTCPRRTEDRRTHPARRYAAATPGRVRGCPSVDSSVPSSIVMSALRPRIAQSMPNRGVKAAVSASQNELSTLVFMP
jgi:hypothetical protein